MFRLRFPRSRPALALAATVTVGTAALVGGIAQAGPGASWGPLVNASSSSDRTAQVGAESPLPVGTPTAIELPAPVETPDEVQAYRLGGDVEERFVARLAQALGIKGLPVRDGEHWTVESDGRQLVVPVDPGVPWQVAADPGCVKSMPEPFDPESGTPRGPDKAAPESSPCLPPERPVGPGDGEPGAMPGKGEPGAMPGKGEPGAMPGAPGDGEPGAPGPEDRERAERVARALLADLEVDTEKAHISFDGTADQVTVVIRPLVGELPTAYRDWFVTVDEQDAISDAAGWSTTPIEALRLPVIPAEDALKQTGDSGTVSSDGMPALPEGEIGVPPVAQGSVTDVRLGLVQTHRVPLKPDVEGEQWLLPAWLVTVDGWEMPILAVPEDLLEPEPPATQEPMPEEWLRSGR